MIERSVNANGISLYTFTNCHLNSFCIAVYVRAGSLYEDINNNGITHLLEHVVFRNIKNQYNGKFYDLLSMNCLDFGATTYKEFLCFSISGPSTGFDFAVDILCRIFSEIQITSEEFNKEKARIKAEIRENSEKRTLDYLYNKKVWQGTSLEKSIIGSCGVLNKVSLKKLNNYRNQIFSADNFFIYVTGNVDNGKVEELKSKLSMFNITESDLKYSNEVQFSERFFNRNGEMAIKSDYWTYVKIGFDVDTQKYSGGVHDLIYSILFKGDNALIYNCLSEDNPLIYSYDSTYEQYNNVGNIMFKFEIEKEKIELALKLIVKALNDLKNGEFDFESNYQCEIGSWKILLDNPSELNWNLAYYNHLLKTDAIDYSDEFLGRYKGVTKLQVMQAAKEIFIKNNLTVAIKGSKNKLKMERVKDILDLI